MGVDHQKGVGAGGGCAPLPREARELLKTLNLQLNANQFATECKPICRHMYQYTHTKLNTSRSGSSIFLSTCIEVIFIVDAPCCVVISESGATISLHVVSHLSE